MKNKQIVPASLQHVLWSCDVKDLDLEKHKTYIIHQILMLGDFSELEWLFKTYSRREIINVFTNVPYKNYPPVAFNFVKNYLLGLKSFSLPEDNYVSAFFGGSRRIPPASFQRA